MKLPAVERLAEINREFYSQHAQDFANTRLRLQPGVRRLLGSLKGDETILDLGCGNGVLAAELSKRGHRGAYLGLDLSGALLEEARARSYEFPARFLEVDLLQPGLRRSTAPVVEPQRQSVSLDDFAQAAEHPWSRITAFAVLHHIPGRENRLALVLCVREWLEPGGLFFVSVWQFLGSPRLRSRIQPWSAGDLTPEELEPNDYLLDWRHGLPGLRYVHHFDEAELSDLAVAAGFTLTEAFYSDGQDRRSGLYQVWRRN